MAATLRLANRSQTAAVDLLTGVLKLRDRSWAAATAAPPGACARPSDANTHVLGTGSGPYGAEPYPPVVETLDLVGIDPGGGAALRAAINDVEDLLAQARRWRTNTLRPESVWLEWNADGEPPKRALVYEGSLRLLHAGGISPLLAGGAAVARLTLTRHPLFEAVETAQQEIANLPLWGSTYLVPAPVRGNEPARVAGLQIGGIVGGGGPLYRLWAGIRDPYEGTDHFHPFWELEAGTPATDAAVVALPGTSLEHAVSVDFGTDPALLNRVSITVAQAVPDHYDGMVGRYLVLARCKLAPGLTAGLQLRAGYGADATLAPCEEVYVDHTNWRLIPLGQVTIPPAGYRGPLGGPTQVGAAQLQVWAELAAGAPAADALLLDALVLVPSEHLAYCTGAEVQDVAGDARPVHFGTLEDDTDFGLSWRAATPSISLDFGLADFYLPLGNPVLVVAAERAAEHVLTDAVRLVLTYATRWLSYRES